jgi:peptidyl-prolyl cis-trans isomerase-like protein 2
VPTQGKAIEQFDHVKRGLTVEDEEEDPSKTSSLRNASEDMKRALGALQV